MQKSSNQLYPVDPPPAYKCHTADGGGGTLLAVQKHIKDSQKHLFVAPIKSKTTNAIDRFTYQKKGRNLFDMMERVSFENVIDIQATPGSSASVQVQGASKRPIDGNSWALMFSLSLSRKKHTQERNGFLLAFNAERECVLCTAGISK
jgi:hypothetical protein